MVIIFFSVIYCIFLFELKTVLMCISALFIGLYNALEDLFNYLMFATGVAGIFMLLSIAIEKLTLKGFWSSVLSLLFPGTLWVICLALVAGLIFGGYQLLIILTMGISTASEIISDLCNRAFLNRLSGIIKKIETF